MYKNFSKLDKDKSGTLEPQEFFDIPDKSVLVGLDRNPKAAAVMTEGSYRAGMLDTYKGDEAHYEVITDEEKAKAEIQQVQREIPLLLRCHPG